MKRCNSKSTLAAFNHHRRLPLIEALESRAVLSVCGVTCDFLDGVLNVHGTPTDDLIAVRYDANASAVSVIGRNDELIGQFPLADVRDVNINGQGGNDQLQVDSHLQQTLNIMGAEGEVAADTASSHRHGAAASNTTAASPTPTNYGPILRSNTTPTPTNASLVLSSTSSSTSTAASANTAATSSMEHSSSHGSGSTDTGSEAHAHDSLMFGGFISSLASFAALQYHSHFANYHPPSTAAASPNGMNHGNASPDAEAGIDSALGDHEPHAVTVSTSVAFTKLVAKPCTVSYSGGSIVTSVDGKRQCNCEQKKQAAEEATRQVFGGEAGPVTGLIASLTNCVPCQQSGPMSGLLAEFQTCSLPMRRSAGGVVLPLLEEHHGGAACPARTTAEAEAAEAAWLQSLQYVGWPLLAASVALLPALWERKDQCKDKRETEDESVPALDWLFGRFNVELLTAR